MTPDEGLKLLLRDHSNQQIHERRTEGLEINARLGGLPLAIDQAAAYISY